MMSCLRPSPKADILPGTSGGSSFTKRFGMPMAARADFSEKYLTPESGLPKAHNLSSVLAFSNGQSPECRPPGLHRRAQLAGLSGAGHRPAQASATRLTSPAPPGTPPSDAPGTTA